MMQGDYAILRGREHTLKGEFGRIPLITLDLLALQLRPLMGIYRSLPPQWMVEISFILWLLLSF